MSKARRIAVDESELVTCRTIWSARVNPMEWMAMYHTSFRWSDETWIHKAINSGVHEGIPIRKRRKP